MSAHKTTGSIRLLFAALLAMLCLMLSISGASAAEKTLPVSARQAGEPTEQVFTRKGKAGNILYIPGAWDITSIRLQVEGQESIILGKDGVTANPETPVDLTPYLGKKTQVFSGNKKTLGTVTIYQGSKIPAIFQAVLPW